VVVTKGRGVRKKVPTDRQQTGRKFCLILELFGLRSTVEIENDLDFLGACKKGTRSLLAKKILDSFIDLFNII